MIKMQFFGSHGGSRAPTLVGYACVALLSSVDVAAQEPPPDSTAVRLTPVVVNVLRTPVSLDRLPYPTSVLAGTDLRRGNAGVSLEETLHGVPGLQIQNRYNYSVGERFSIRGFGARAQFGVRGIRVLVDGIPATLPDGQSTLDHVDIGSLGRAEAIRGPASALFGNAAGGVLSFETRPPSGSIIEEEVTTVFGSDGLQRLQSTTSGTHGQTSYLFNLARLSYDGFRTNLNDPTGQPYGNAERWNLTGQLRQGALGGQLRITANFVELDAENPGSLPADRLSDEAKPAWGFNVAQGTRKDMRQAQIGASWLGPVGDLEGEVALYGLTRTLDNPIPSSVIDLDRRAGGMRAVASWQQASGESRLDGVRLTGGVELDFQRDDRQNFDNDGGSRGALARDQFERVWSTGLFVNLAFPLQDRAHIVAAIRYDRFSFDVDDRFVSPTDPDESGSRTLDALSPSVGIHLALSEAAWVYASVSESFQTPTTTELANRPDGGGGFNQSLNPQTGLTYEAGLRGQLGSFGSYETAVFWTALEDELIPFEDASQPGRTFFRNAGTSRYGGVEGTVSANLGSGVSGQVTYTWTDAEYENYSLDGVDLGGNRIPGLAPHRLEGTLRAQRGAWFGEVRAEYSDATPVNDVNDAEADSYTLLHLRAGAEEQRVGRLRISPFIGLTNVTDQLYISSVVVNAFGSRYFEPGPSRSFYLGMRAAWAR